MKPLLVCILAVVFFELGAMAQPPAPAEAEPAAEEASAPPNAEDAEAGADATGEAAGAEESAKEEDDGLALLKGDVVELANGKKLEGVQIVRKTPKGYEVQTLPDLPPLLIPLKQVKNVTFDEVDPRRMGDDAGTPAETPAKGAFDAEEISKEMHDKLTVVLTQEPLVYADADLFEVLDATVVKAGVPLEIEPSLRELPPAQRAWTVTIAPGTNSYTLLKEMLPAAFPGIEVMNTFDRVVIRPKAEAPAVPPAP